MQEEDRGKSSQAPWMTGGAWKNTPIPTGAKRNKAKNKPAHISSTTEHQDEATRFQTEVDLADLKLELRSWNFARSWKKTAASDPLPDEAAPLSPRTRPPLPLEDAEEAAEYSQDKEFFTR